MHTNIYIYDIYTVQVHTYTCEMYFHNKSTEMQIPKKKVWHLVETHRLTQTFRFTIVEYPDQFQANNIVATKGI